MQSAHSAESQQVRSIWDQIDAYEQKNPVYGIRIQQWRQTVRQRLPIDEELRRYDKYVTSLQKNLDRITATWGIELDQLLSSIRPPSGWSLALTDALATMANMCQPETAITLLQAQVEQRASIPWATEGFRGVPRDRWLLKTDVKAVKNTLRPASLAPLPLDPPLSSIETPSTPTITRKATTTPPSKALGELSAFPRANEKRTRRKVSDPTYRYAWAVESPSPTPPQRYHTRGHDAQVHNESHSEHDIFEANRSRLRSGRPKRQKILPSQFDPASLRKLREMPIEQGRLLFQIDGSKEDPDPSTYADSEDSLGNYGLHDEPHLGSFLDLTSGTHESENQVVCSQDLSRLQLLALIMFSPPRVTRLKALPQACSQRMVVSAKCSTVWMLQASSGEQRLTSKHSQRCDWRYRSESGRTGRQREYCLSNKPSTK